MICKQSRSIDRDDPITDLKKNKDLSYLDYITLRSGILIANNIMDKNNKID